MEAPKGTLVLAFGAHLGGDEHIRYRARGDILGVVLDNSSQRDTVVVLDIDSCTPQSFSPQNILVLAQTDIDPRKVPVEDLKEALRALLREQPERIVLNLTAGLGRKILDLEARLENLRKELLARI